MLSRAQRKLIYQGMPEEITIEGKTFTVAKRYANQYKAEVFPAVTLRFGGLTDPKTLNLDRVRRKEVNSTVSDTYVTGTDLYELDPDYAMSISSVVGVVSGSAYTFDPTEYQLANQGPTGYYSQIEFLGPTKPDNGSTFSVTYKHAWVRSWQGGEFRDVVSVEVWAKDSEIETPAGEKKFVNGMLIVQELVEIFTQWFRYFCDDLSNEFTVDSVSEVRDLDGTVEGEEERRRQFDVHIAHVESVEKTKVATIETVDEPDYTVE